MSSVRICFVCLGNICRSPTAEGIMRHLVGESGLEGQVHVESAGTGDWHVGEPPDERARQTARQRGYELSSEARQFQRHDFDRFDYVIAMDASNRKALQRLAPRSDAEAKIHMLRDFEPGGGGGDVPDPYYGGGRGFDNVFRICEESCQKLLERVRGDLERV